MHDKSGFDFTQFVPGFDFLKNMSAGSGAAASAAQPSWVAPTLDPAELDKRIQELKTVHFWLDQNTKAVSATIQALEVQRMTLSALQNMNVSFGEMADALKIKPQAAAFKPTPARDAAPPKRKTKSAASSGQSGKAQAAGAGMDPSQWWGALTQQFQTIADTALHEMAKNAQTHPGAPAAAAAVEPSAAKPTRQPTAAKRSARARPPSASRARSRK